MKYKLRDLITIKHGFAFSGEHIKTEDNGVVLVTPGNFKIGGGFKEDKCKFFDGDYSDEYVLHSGDLIVTMTDLSKAIDTLGYSAIVPQTKRVYLHNQRIGLVRITSDILDKGYLYWFMRTPKYQKTIAATSSGSTVHHTSPDRIRDVEIDLPDIETQKKVAGFLSALDDKIELNNRINENLEQQAQALFKSWFIDFDPFDEEMVPSPVGMMIPESMKMVQIDELPHILETGKRPKGGAVAEGIPSVGAESVKKLGAFDPSSAKYIPHDFAATLKKGMIRGYELLIYKDGGKPGTFTPHFSMFGEGFPYESFFINEHVFKLDFQNRGFNEFAYFYFQTDYPYNWLASNGGKAAIPGINQNDVNSIWIYDPSHPKVQEYCEWIQPLFTSILRNCGQNLKLVQLRDALIPKLMSGELDVSEIEL